MKVTSTPYNTPINNISNRNIINFKKEINKKTDTEKKDDKYVKISKTEYNIDKICWIVIGVASLLSILNSKKK